jgi:DNA-binding response OmpR family regulator
MRVLLVEDDRPLADTIKRGLMEECYAVDVTYDGEEAEYLAENNPYDTIILDIMLPKKDGVTVCQQLRLKEVNTPILMLTAKDAVEDRVKGLDAGADDYLIKPFAFNELLARVRALLRRDSVSKSSILQVGDLIMNTLTREVWRGQKAIELTSKEYAILDYFMRHPNIVITRTKLEEHVWDYEFNCMSNLIDVFIHRLRCKIDEDGGKSLIQTIRWAGYRLRAH